MRKVNGLARGLSIVGVNKPSETMDEQVRKFQEASEGKPTAEELARREEKRTRLREIASRVSAMTPAEREPG
jgi:hypothetical protein